MHTNNSNNTSIPIHVSTQDDTKSIGAAKYSSKCNLGVMEIKLFQQILINNTV